MKRAMILIGWIAVAVVLIGLVVAMIEIGPRNLWGMLLYDQRQEGDLVVGEAAPDVALRATDGETTVRLAERLGRQPVVLVFGSFT